MKYLIVNADDFGLTGDVNSAVKLAHQNGILTSATLMINEEGAQEAVLIAKENPDLGVGLHLSLVHGTAALPSKEISAIVTPNGKFISNPVVAGLRFFFLRKCKNALRKEIEAQIIKFLETGIKPTHIDGHLHIHLHPSVLNILLPLLEEYDIKAVRVPKESLFRHLAIDPENIVSKVAHAIIFGILGKRARKMLFQARVAYPDYTFGLLQSGNMNKEFVVNLIPAIKEGFTEISFHIARKKLSPEIGAPNYHYTEELETLLDARIKNLIKKENIQLANYGTLRKIKIG